MNTKKFIELILFLITSTILTVGIIYIITFIIPILPNINRIIASILSFIIGGIIGLLCSKIFLKNW